MLHQFPLEATSRAPLAPRTVDETGGGQKILFGLIFKAMYVLGLSVPTALSKELKLSRGIVEFLLEDAKEQSLVEVLGALGAQGASPLAELRYTLTGKGRDWAIDALSQSQYVGPVPVTLDAFRSQVERQSVANERPNFATFGECFSSLVMPETLVKRLGPAVFSGRSILVYGPPGNGKTVVAEAIGKVFEQTIFVPHCIEVDGQIIKIFDTTVHRVAEKRGDGARGRSRQGEEPDPRWVECHRPVVVTGGELTLDMLDLSFNPYARFYEAPMQMKATGGLFIIDDFGRQLVKPQDVLNRWIVPLDKHYDFLTLHTGKKFPVPYDALVMFSTNIAPEKLMDAGALRRIYYKIEIGPPVRADFEQIFRNVCVERDVDLPDWLFTYLYEEFYKVRGIDLARYHPRFIVEEVMAACEFEGKPVLLDREILGDVLQNLYITHRAEEEAG